MKKMFCAAAINGKQPVVQKVALAVLEYERR
jgi:hypothetical protein